MAVVPQADIQTLIYKTEFYIINKDYRILLEEEYGSTFVNAKAASKLQLLRMLLKALKIQYNLDYTAEVASSLYYKIQRCVGLDLSTLPAINTDLVVYSADNVYPSLYGAVILATYEELLADLPEDANHVITVSVFNEYFNNLDFNVKIFKDVIDIEDGLSITHGLNTEQISVQFHTTTGPIFCEFEIIDENTIELISNSEISDVNIIVLG